MTTADCGEYPRAGRTVPELPDGIQECYERDREYEWRATLDRVAALRQSFAEERRHVFSPELREKIVSAVRRDRPEDPRGPGLRYRSHIEARGAGVDLGALKGLQDRAYGEFIDVVKGPGAFHWHEIVAGNFADILQLPPFTFVPPDPDKEQVFFPPFSRSLDRANQTLATGDGEILENSSYLSGPSRMGSKQRARNSDAGDVEILNAIRENGYLVPFTMLRTGILQVKVDLSALICRHHVSTEDEWGWSDFHAITQGRLVMAVFWDFDDAPANEVSHQWFVSGLDCRGDGESFPGTTVQALPGERRILNMFTEMAFPSGQELWVYVGVADSIWALLNDVSIRIEVDSAWLLNSLAIRSI